MISGPPPVPFPAADDIDSIRARYPGWDIHAVFGGYEAVPAGTVIIRGAYLETLAEKLEAAE